MPGELSIPIKSIEIMIGYSLYEELDLNTSDVFTNNKETVNQEKI